MPRKKLPEKHSDVPDWIVSYGDVMSLLLTFFVLLFAFSTIDAEKWKQVVQSFTGKIIITDDTSQISDSIINFDNQVIINSPDAPEDFTEPSETTEETAETESETQKEEFEEDFENLYRKLMALTDAPELNLELEVIKTNYEIILRFNNQILFKSGEAILNTSAAGVLDLVINVLEEFKYTISTVYIEGNTDSVPISTDKYRDNFELSVYRALVVLYYVIDNSIFPQDMLVALGHGEHNPIADNLTEEGKAKNRRTDIVLIKKTSDAGGRAR